MVRAAVRILHLEPDQHTGELGTFLAEARAIVAADLVRRFAQAGAPDAEIVAVRRDDGSFGQRLRELAAGIDGGLVVLGSGSIPLAGDTTLAALVATAASGDAIALTNNRYSSDVVALGRAGVLAAVPDLPADNVLPRWLATRAGVTVSELPDRERLAIDLDSPLDIELVRRHADSPPPLAGIAESMDACLAEASGALERAAAVARDPARELLIAGRTSAATLARLERATACRVRAIIEERGLRAAALAASQRSPASVLGQVLDGEGPEAFGRVVGRLADAALIDTRVLLAHRHGADERRWPSPEDRFASDLLLADRVRDPWLRALTDSSRSAALPIALGGHTLVGPGVGLALGLPSWES